MPFAYGPVDGKLAFFTAVTVGIFQLVCMGTYAAYPVLLDSLHKDKRLGNPSQTTLSFAQSIVMIVLPPLGIVAGIATDKFGPRPVLFLSGLSLLLMTQILPEADSVGALLTIYSIFMGLTTSLLTAPGPTAIGSWFSEEKVSFGIAIGEAGVALGTCLMPLATGLLLTHYDHDWRKTVRMLGTLAAIPVLLSAVIRQRLGEVEKKKGSSSRSGRRLEDGVNNDSCRSNQSPSEAEQQKVEEDDDEEEEEEGPPPTPAKELLLSKMFGIVFVSQLLFGLGYFGTLFIVAPYARLQGVSNTTYAGHETITTTESSSLYTYFGFCSAVGAILVGLLASKINTQIVIGAACTVASLVGLLNFVHKYYELALLFGLLGFSFSGGLLGLPSLVMENFGDSPAVNLIMSASFFGFGVGGAVAPPVMSALKEHSSGQSYLGSSMVCFVSLLLVGALNLWTAQTGGVGVGGGESGTEEEKKKLISSSSTTTPS